MKHEEPTVVGFRFCCVVGLCLLLGGRTGFGQQSPQAKPANQDAESRPDFSRAQLEHFERRIRPLLSRRCFQCHSRKAKQVKAGLYLDSRVAILQGGDSGPALKPGDVKGSLLAQSIRYTGDYEMPPQGKLPANEIKLLEDWIRDGAPWPKASDIPVRDKIERADLDTLKAQHWVWQPVDENVQPGAIRNTSWPRTPIDHFIMARLESRSLKPAPAADRRTLLRRVSFDLTGLPPAPDDLRAFLADTSPKAYAQAVDRLLNSRAFGERWGRHWLDLVRYAESRGHEFDYNSPNAHQYRDYVIRAYNADVPYNQFVREHLAGDLLAEPRLNPQDGSNESILGTGFWFLGEWCHSPVDIRKDEIDRFDNMIDVVGKTFLGLTISCARCHDHKFDPIPTTDYYGLSGFLQSSSYRLARFDTLDHNRGVAEQLDVARRRARTAVARDLARAQLRGLQDFRNYLLAARETLQRSLSDRPESIGDPQKRAEHVRAVAADHKLQASRLEACVQHLVSVQDQTQDPLHVWARLALTRGDLNVEKLRQVLAGVVRGWKKNRPKSQPIAAEHMIWDARRATGPWLQDGSTFRLGPVEQGQILLSLDSQQPVTGVATFAAARTDPAFSGLQLAAGAQNDAGRIAGWVRAGKTWRSPTFVVESGWVHCLVEGPGYCFAAVDSHRMINGPLHGEVVQQWKAADGPQWISQNLSRYQGHPVHLEFTPQGDTPLAVIRVQQGQKRPSALPPEFGIEHGWMAEFAPSRHASLEDVASRLTELLIGTATRLEQGRSETSGQQGDQPAVVNRAILADWLVRHGSLLGMPAPFTNWQPQTREALAAFRQQAGRVRKKSRLAMAMWDGQGEDDYVLIRGNSNQRGTVVPRRFLAALGGEQQPREFGPGSGRQTLAELFVDPGNPLTGRVMVNRVWHHLFGRGLVRSVDNFGVLGDRPTHPELLDYLTAEFVKDGWSIKRLIRRIVLSQTYQMSSQASPASLEIDPDNQLLQHARVRRLQGEAIRDAMLAANGKLDAKMFGPSVPVHLTAFMQGRGRPRSGPLDGHGRRSIYLSVRRNFLSPMLLAFDMPQPFSTMGRRTVSNVPAQALILMNDPFVVQQAERLADRLLKDQTLDVENRLRRLYELTLSRLPTDLEVQAARTFLQKQGERYGIAELQRSHARASWIDLCHVLFNTKEFVFIQ